jgi:hypothetical protein
MVFKRSPLETSAKRPLRQAGSGTYRLEIVGEGTYVFHCERVCTASLLYTHLMPLFYKQHVWIGCDLCHCSLQAFGLKQIAYINQYVILDAFICFVDRPIGRPRPSM